MNSYNIQDYIDKYVQNHKMEVCHTTIHGSHMAGLER